MTRWLSVRHWSIYRIQNCLCILKSILQHLIWFSSVHFSRSVVSNSLRTHGLQHARPPCPSPTPGVDSNSCHRGGDGIQPSHTLSPPYPPAFNLAQHQDLFKWVSSSHQVAKVFSWVLMLSFSFNIKPSNKYPGLLSFRMDWLDLLAVQGTLKSLFQHHSSKASILQRSAFFIVQLSQPYMTTGKTIALTRRTFVGKVMSLLLNMLSRLVITFFQGVQFSSVAQLCPTLCDTMNRSTPSIF